MTLSSISYFTADLLKVSVMAIIKSMESRVKWNVLQVMTKYFFLHNDMNSLMKLNQSVTIGLWEIYALMFYGNVLLQLKYFGAKLNPVQFCRKILDTCSGVYLKKAKKILSPDPHPVQIITW